MRQFIIACCVLSIATGVASANDYPWNGSASSAWNNNSNWTGFGRPDDNGDRATIADTSNNPVDLAADTTIGALVMRNGTSGTPAAINISSGVTLTLDDTGSYDGGFIVGNSSDPSYVEMTTGAGALSAVYMDIDATAADANGEDVVFRHAAGTISTSGALSMYASDSYNAEAHVIIDAANFSPNSLDLYGGSTSSRRVFFDVNDDFSVNDTAMTSDSLMSGYIAFDVADGKTADLKDGECVADATIDVTTAGTGKLQFSEFRVQEPDDEAITVTKAGGGDIEAGSFVIAASANHGATITVSNGSIVTN